MVVLEAPTEDDMEAGHLLAGWSGRMLQKALPAEVYVVTVLTKPLTKKSKLTLEDYNGFVERISSCRPVVIAPLGGIALRAVSGLSNIMDWRGYIIAPEAGRTFEGHRPIGGVYKSGKRKGQARAETEKVDVPIPILPSCRHIIPTISIETVQNSGLTLLNVMRGDLARAHRFAEQPDSKISADSAFTFLSTVAGEFPSTLAIDIETNAKNEIADVGFASQYDTWSTPWTFGAANVVNWTRVMIAHNAAFDVEHFMQEKLTGVKGGISLEHCHLWCTMLAAYMLNPDGKKSLNWVISQYLDARRHKHLMGSQYRRYNALDARQTYDLFLILRQGLKETGQLEFFENAMMPALPPLIRMHMRGLRIDQEFVKQWESELQWSINEIEMSAGENRNLLSKPLALAKKLGSKNSDEETLLKLKLKNHPETELIDLVLRYRDAAKNLSTYLQKAERVYPGYLPGQRDDDEGNKGIAYSGRPTASKPNIQNQPKEARRQYLPDPGNVLVSLDWSQIEPRIAAAMSGDDTFASDIERGLYKAVGETVGCDYDAAKTVVLLSAYLGSPRVLQNKLMLNGVNKSFAECKQLQDRMFARYHKWAKWRQWVIEQAERQRWLRNPFGKWAPFVRVHPAKAVNFFPQSGAACILWHCLPQVEKAIAPYGGLMYNTVHDEITFQVPEDYKEMLPIWAAKKVMEQPWPQLGGLVVPVKVKVGKNWKEMEEVK